MKEGRKAIFLDRDGVINVDRGYVFRRRDFEYIPGSVRALKAFKAAGYWLIVVTNQSGIGRGLYTIKEYEDLTAWMRGDLEKQGVMLDAVYFCPHFPTALVAKHRVDCCCRKPKPGMILQAANRCSINLVASIMVGDKKSDIDAGRLAGVGRCYLISDALGVAASGVEDGVFSSLHDVAKNVLDPKYLQ